MKRWIALVVGALAVVVVAACPVAAVPAAPAGGSGAATSGAAAGGARTVPSDAVGLTLSQVPGGGLAVTLDPGASEEHDIVVANHTADLRLTVKLSATDATGNLGTNAASWLAFADDELQLDPHVATTVPMTVAVPHDTQPGSALAHVTATVQSAVAAADGSPVAGTANVNFPVSIAVRGTPTAQLAIADVHRVDQGSRHQLAVVLRNFGNQGTNVSGHVVVAGDQPQTIPFRAQLAASRDTTVDVAWRAPAVGTPSDIAVDLEYGDGNVASWSSRLGGAPTDLSPPTTNTVATPTTTGDTNTTPSPSSSIGPSSAKPWWKQTIIEVLAVLGLLAAAAWFVFEMHTSRRRRDELGVPSQPVNAVATTAFTGDGIRVEVVVHLPGVGGATPWQGETRARSPDPPEHDAQEARAGPSSPDRAPPARRDRARGRGLAETRGTADTHDGRIDAPSSASPAPGTSARSDQHVFRSRDEATGPARPDPAGEDLADWTSTTMARLVELDRERRRARRLWLEAEQLRPDRE